MDGKIVYQVRVDSSHVPSDLAAAGSQINSGTAALVSLGSSAAERIGSALNTFFGAQGSAMSDMLTKLTGGFSQLSGSTSGAASALSPLITGISSLLGLDLNRLLSFFNQLPTATAMAGATLATAGTEYLASKVSSSSKQTNTPARYRSGSDYIEKDKYALLHKGEAVLTAAENETLRAMGGIEGVMAAERNVAVMPVQEQPAPVMQQPQPQNVNVTVELDGYQMAKVMATATNELNRQLNTRVIK